MEENLLNDEELKRIRLKHIAIFEQKHPMSPTKDATICASCNTFYPCDTIELLDMIEETRNGMFKISKSSYQKCGRDDMIEFTFNAPVSCFALPIEDVEEFMRQLSNLVNQIKDKNDNLRSL